jgi:hypothetical protein
MKGKEDTYETTSGQGELAAMVMLVTMGVVRVVGGTSSAGGTD